MLALATLSSAPAAEAKMCASAANPIVCENALPGDPQANWQVEGDGDPTIQGYATSMSVNVGETESVQDRHARVLIPHRNPATRLLRWRWSPSGRVQHHAVDDAAADTAGMPDELLDRADRLRQLGRLGARGTCRATPSRASTSPHLVRNDNGEDSQIPFVVRNDSSHSEILLQTSDATWEAYNDYGGNSLYTCTVACPPGEPEGYKAAYAVSYNRPFDGSLRDRRRRLLSLVRRIPDDATGWKRTATTSATRASRRSTRTARC